MGQRENTSKNERFFSVTLAFLKYGQQKADALNDAITVAKDNIAAGRGNVEAARHDLAELQQQKAHLYNGFKNSTFGKFLDEALAGPAKKEE